MVLIAHVLSDDSGRFLAVDDAFCDITARPPAELKGCGLLDITDRRDLRISEAHLDTLRKDNVAFTLRKRYVRPDCSRILVQEHVSRFKDGRGPHRLMASVQIVRGAADAVSALPAGPGASGCRSLDPVNYWALDSLAEALIRARTLASGLADDVTRAYTDSALLRVGAQIAQVARQQRSTQTGVAKPRSP